MDWLVDAMPAESDSASPRRILVIGIAGAGKTTLALQMAEALSLPTIHLDALFWRPGWEPTPREEWRRLLAELVKRDSWVMDGNYDSSLDIRLPAADTVVLLDLPRRVCMWRVVIRWLKHIGRTRPDMGPGCLEKVDWEFLKWIWDYPRHALPTVLRQLDALPPGRAVFRLRSQREIDRFVVHIRTGALARSAASLS